MIHRKLNDILITMFILVFNIRYLVEQRWLIFYGSLVLDRIFLNTVSSSALFQDTMEDRNVLKTI